MNREMIEKIVRDILAEKLNDNPNDIYDTADGVIRCKIQQLKPEPFDTGKQGDDVKLIDAFTLDQSKRLGCGLMEMKETTFDWHLDYDEINYVIEGELHIIKNGHKVIAKQGEIIHTPAGSDIQFSAPKYAKFTYVTYPADWS